MSADVDHWYKDYVSKVGKPSYHQGQAVSNLNNWNNATNSVYAVVFDDDTFWRVDYGVCYGHLNDLDHNARHAGYHGSPEAVFVQIQTPALEDKGFTADMRHTYYEWLFNYSPFRKTFITKDHTKALADQVVVLDANAEANLLVSACSAVRLPWESWYVSYKIATIGKLWYELVAQGDDPTAAMSVASNFVTSSGGWALRKETAGHQFLSTGCMDTMLNFIKGKHIKTPSLKEAKGTDDKHSLTGIWETSHPKAAPLLDGMRVTKWFDERITGVSGKAVNPFSSYSSPSYKLPALKEGLSVAIKELVSNA